MRKEGVDAGHSLLRILGVDLVFDLAVFFLDGQDARGGERFERIGRLGVDHAETNGKIVADIKDSQR